MRKRMEEKMQKKKTMTLTTLLLCLSILTAPMAQTAHAEGDEDPVYQLTADVSMYAFSSAETTGQPLQNEDVVISLKTEDKTLNSGNEGKIQYTFENIEQRIDTGKYSYKIEKNEDHYEATGTIEEGTEETPKENKIYVRERYIPTDADYKFSASDDVKDIDGEIWVKSPGTYTIEGTSGKKLSETLDGTAKNSINITVASDGSIGDFYVYNGEYCSKALSGQNVHVDTGAPVVTSVVTTAAAPGTYVKEHGIYGKEKAELALKVTMTEETLIKEVYLVTKKDGQTTRYDATKTSGSGGNYTATIGLPDEETLMEAQLVKLVAKDVFEKTSDEVLIAQTEEGSRVTLESDAPSIEYAITPKANANGWHNTLPSIAVTASDANSGVSSIEVYQDNKLLKGENFDNKKTTAELTADAAITTPSSTGSYTFKIKATDNSGNESNASFNLKIDTVAPSVSFSGVENGKDYSSAPRVSVDEDERYYAEDGNKIKVNVYKNGKRIKEYTESGKKSFVIPTSIFANDAEYRITAKAVDAAGNESEQKEVTFIKDGEKPTLTLESTDKANANGWYKTLPDVKTTARDTLSGLATFELSEDGNALASKTYDKRTRSLEVITKKSIINTPSADGSYTFRTTARDRAGNIAEKTLKLKIDLVAPVITASGVQSGEHYITVPAIQVTENEKYYNAEGAYIRYSIGRDGHSVADEIIKKTNKVTIPTSLFATDGDYTVNITATDAAGNVSNKITYNFVRDATAPDLTLTGAAEGIYYATPQTITLKVIERYFQTNNVSVSAVKNLGGSTANVGFPWSNTGKTSTSSKTFSDTGTYTVTASAVDKAGNKSGTQSITFTVDTVPPVIKITGVTNGGVYTYGQGVSPHVEVTDDYLATKTITYTKAGVVISNPSFAQVKENDGVYTLTVVATDMSGNTSRQQVTFTLNRFGSHFEYNDAIKNLQGKGVQNVEKDLVITEKNVSKVIKSDSKIFKDNKALSSKAKTTAKEDGAEKIYKHVFAATEFAEEGAYELNVISKDEAGNEMESKAENGPVIFYVDRTEPSLMLAGIDPKGNNASSITVTITASDLLTGVKEVTAKVNGETPAVKEEGEGVWSFTVGEGMRQNIEVTAVDGAGNKAVVTETASVSTSKLSLFLDRFKFIILGLVALLAGLLIFLLAKRRKKNEEEAKNADKTRTA